MVCRARGLNLGNVKTTDENPGSGAVNVLQERGLPQAAAACGGGLERARFVKGSDRPGARGRAYPAWQDSPAADGR